MRRTWKLGIAVLGLVAPVAAHAQQSVQWDADRAILAGNGCTKDVDAFVAENGNDLSVVFSRLGIDLPGNQSSSLAGRSSCIARIPATIAPGFYIGQLTQTVSFGITKTARTRGAISTKSTFAGFNVSPYEVLIPYGRSMNEPLLTQTRRDLFTVRTSPDWFNGWCSRNRAPKVMYQANIAVSGQKDSAREDLIVAVDGLDLRYEVAASLVRCQL